MPDFSSEEQWRGSYYELAVELSPPDDACLRRALEVLWSDPHLEGPWSGRAEVGRAPVARPVLAGDPLPLYGRLTLPHGERVGCLSWTVREEEGSDWLDLCVPTGMLVSLGLRHPLNLGSDPLLLQLDALFLRVAERLHAAVPFDLALVGEEVSGQVSAAWLTPAWLERYGGCLLSASLWERLAPRVPARQLGSGLRWVPFARSS
ncbi:MAG TPA: hypothetical protein VHG28_16670 [Longimicrobiaceae bacterium]|nr:hypothetical protein [Longimicrobiaceae bacterium]